MQNKTVQIVFKNLIVITEVHHIYWHDINENLTSAHFCYWYPVEYFEILSDMKFSEHLITGRFIQYVTAMRVKNYTN